MAGAAKASVNALYTVLNLSIIKYPFDKKTIKIYK
jgi:hypothetical protein